MNDYGICFPQGFFLYSIILLKNTSPKKKLLDRTIEAEKNLFNLISLNGGCPVTDSTVSCVSCEAVTSHKKGEKVRIKSEWVDINLTRLKSIISFFESHYKAIVHKALTDFKEPYIHTFVIDNEDTDVIKEHRGWELVPAFIPRTRRARQIKPAFKGQVMLKGSL